MRAHKLYVHISYAWLLNILASVRCCGKNHGEFLILEISRGKGKAAQGQKPLQVKVKADEITCNAMLKVRGSPPRPSFYGLFPDHPQF